MKACTLTSHIFPSVKKQSGFLKPDHRKNLGDCYKEWLRYLKPESVIDKLMTRHLLVENDLQKLESKTTIPDKNRLLFSEVLMLSTYEDLYEIKSILEETS